jgi:hypothetical protein
MATDKHSTAANATVGVFFGVRSGDDVIRCFLCGLFTGYITKGTSQPGLVSSIVYRAGVSELAVMSEYSYTHTAYMRQVSFSFEFNLIKTFSGLKSMVFWAVTPCRSETARRFGGAHCLHLQGPGVNQERNQQKQAASIPLRD